MVTLERGHLSWFRYPTHNIGTYLGRGVSVIINEAVERQPKKMSFNEKGWHSLPNETRVEETLIRISIQAVSVSQYLSGGTNFQLDDVITAFLCLEAKN